MTERRGTQPNIVIVVLDTVRALDFPGTSTTPPPMPFVEQLLSESLTFTRAVSPSSWTLPSHLSLLTGVPPWEFGPRSPGAWKADDRLQTLPMLLRAREYSTVLLSSNYLLSPEFGFGREFDAAAWGGWWELFSRPPSVEFPPSGEGVQTGSPRMVARNRSGALWKALSLARPALLNRFALIDFVNTTRSWLQTGARPPLGGLVAPWLEPTFGRWLKSQHPNKPIFALINYLDAHEPYASTSSDISSLTSWLRYFRLHQDTVDLNSGSWTPSNEDLKLFRDLYRGAITRMDDRIKYIVQTLKDDNRWESTLLVITSDHGQLLGESGKFYHMFHGEEAAVRVPLIYRPPEGMKPRRTCNAWASLIDIAPTLLDRIGLPVPGAMIGENLEKLADTGIRQQPVGSMVEGLGLAHEDSRLRQSLSHWDRVAASVYMSETKVTSESNRDRAVAYSVGDDPSHEVEVAISERDEAQVRSAEAIVRKLKTQASLAPRAEVDGRLAAWGYS